MQYRFTEGPHSLFWQRVLLQGLVEQLLKLFILIESLKDNAVHNLLPKIVNVPSNQMSSISWSRRDRATSWVKISDLLSSIAACRACLLNKGLMKVTHSTQHWYGSRLWARIRSFRLFLAPLLPQVLNKESLRLEYLWRKWPLLDSYDIGRR